MIQGNWWTSDEERKKEKKNANPLVKSSGTIWCICPVARLDVVKIAGELIILILISSDAQ